MNSNLSDKRQSAVRGGGGRAPGRGGSRYKGPETGVCLTHWRNRQEASVVGAERAMGRVGGEESPQEGRGGGVFGVLWAAVMDPHPL